MSLLNPCGVLLCMCGSSCLFFHYSSPRAPQTNHSNKTPALFSMPAFEYFSATELSGAQRNDHELMMFGVLFSRCAYVIHFWMVHGTRVLEKLYSFRVRRPSLFAQYTSLSYIIRFVCVGASPYTIFGTHSPVAHIKLVILIYLLNLLGSCEWVHTAYKIAYYKCIF